MAEISDDVFVINNLSVLFNVSVVVAIFLNLNRFKRIKVNLLLLGVGVFFWMVGDLLWLIYEEYTTIIPDTNVFLLFVYMLTNIFFLISGVHYFFKNYKYWNSYQLALDLLAVSMIAMLSFERFLFGADFLAVMSIYESSILYIYMASDLMLIYLLVIMVFQVGRKTYLLQTVIIGILIFSVSDLFFTYAYLMDIHLADSFLDYATYFSFLVIGIGVITEKSVEYAHQRERLAIKILPRKRKLVWLLLLFPLASAYFRYLNTLQFFIVMSIILLYETLSRVIKNQILTEQLVEKQKEYSQKLEEEVTRRTAELQKLNQTLALESITDPLTKAFNRAYYFDEIKRRIRKGAPFSVISIDINKFKNINDIHGHQIGDEILIGIVKRFTQNACDSSAFARIGGDEFALISELYLKEDLNDLIGKINHIFENGFHVKNFTFYLDCTLGIAIYPKNGETHQELVRNADIALIHAKSKGEKVVFYNYDMVSHILRNNTIVWNLETMNYKDEFTVFYQPQFTCDKELIGMEALIRWNNPELGFVSPGEFIPIAEESGYIIEITHFVFQEAFEQIKKWNDLYNKNLTVGINISPQSFLQKDFIEYLTNLVKEYNVDPKWIDLEITEHSTMPSADLLVDIFKAIDDLGISVSIDDFGTGYSSLSYIKQFEVDQLKIAKELIDHINSVDDDQVIVQATILMAKEMNLLTIAEGVETKEQLDLLKEAGCDRIQGYYLGKPTDSKNFEEIYLKNIS
jgi:diguanylate cyclase (GGDEF)-like protein